MIRSGAVSLAGSPIREPAALIHEDSTVLCAGQPIQARRKRYLMLNKPAGVVCSTRDGEHRTVLDLLDQATGLHPVGRLDLDSTGLVLLTDDGDWSHAITAPRRRCAKIYRIGLAAPLEPRAVACLCQGVLLRGDPRPTLPAQLVRLDERSWRITISEGRYHQVKRMLAAVGNRVESLHREQIGAIRLDPALAPGDYRPLTPAEIDSV